MAKRSKSASERAAQAERLRCRPARGQILAAARGLADSRGYEAIRVGELAEAAGVSRETFYTHVADKRACLAEAVAPGLGEIEQLLRISEEEGQEWAEPILATLDEQLAQRFDADQGPRGRILSAMVELVARRGFAPVRLADVIKAAHVSYPSFYRHFESKEQCFAVSRAELVGRLEDRVAVAVRSDASGAEATQPGLVQLRALAEIFAAERDVARVLLLECGGLGAAEPKTGSAPAASSPLVALVGRLLAATLPPARRDGLELLSGALVEAMREKLLADEPGQLPVVIEGLLEMFVGRVGRDAGGRRRDTPSRAARRSRASREGQGLRVATVA